MRRRPAHDRLVALPLMVALLFGCSTSDGAGGSKGFAQPDLTVGENADTDASGGPSDTENVTTVPLQDKLPAGRYASKQLLANKMIVPALGEPQTTVTTTWIIHDLQHNGDKTVAKTQVCKLEQQPVVGVVTTFPAALVASVPQTTQQVTGEQAQDGVIIRWQADAVVLGAEPTSVTTEALADMVPVDTDKDGHPGATVTVTGLVSGKMFIIQRTIGGMHGKLGQSGAVDGLFDGYSEQRAIGGEPEALGKLGLSFSKVQDPMKSSFQWRKIADDLSCADMLIKEKTIFP